MACDAGSRNVSRSDSCSGGGKHDGKAQQNTRKYRVAAIYAHILSSPFCDAVRLDDDKLIST